jgi:hypothetical protein
VYLCKVPSGLLVFRKEALFTRDELAMDALLPKMDLTSSIVIGGVFLALAWLTAGLRAFTRGYLLGAWGWDDTAMVVTIVSEDDSCTPLLQFNSYYLGTLYMLLWLWH